MISEVAVVKMDTTVDDALRLCVERRIRHLPVVDEENRLSGLVTERDMRTFLSSRIGTNTENKSDGKGLKRPVHLVMIRNPVTATPEISLSEAALQMLTRRVGCLPVIDTELHVVGIVTASDFLKYLANSRKDSTD